MSVLCQLGMHIFHWPPHYEPSALWEDFPVECERGCGARRIYRCATAPTNHHWLDRHKEPQP